MEIIVLLLVGVFAYLIIRANNRKSNKALDTGSNTNYDLESKLDNNTSQPTDIETNLSTVKEISSKTKKKKEWKRFRTKIAGLKHYDASIIVKSLTVGTQLILKRDPSNSYDANAVKIFYGKYLLGHVPAIDSEIVAKVMDTGEEVSAEIARAYVSPYDHPEHGHFMEISVYIVRPLTE
ncbi:HIRAN domain-containing protein [Spirosoma linguale]|uniref:HIRAN protein n=1 Tax=Spirosoma linguale (strain ATCC 33905 / DSM 74 / LMG 10896 / Claus 1) TaxID=504472 RepID=D2QSP3_SPILD|nr:HIRAN protein [Spirosoma linguale DSM 74]